MSVRDLPSVDRLVRHLDSELPTSVVSDVARAAIAVARARILEGGSADATALATESVRRLERSRPTPVINATGVLLHTNLGRAPLHPLAAEVASWTATGYSNLELNLTDGRRGGRTAYLDELLRGLTGAEATLVVNNNAAALFLTLAALASGREVPVSRGELIEIGGSYRLPELMAASGTELIEVGTTNRTRIGDYSAAIGDRTAMLLKVHPSNYRISGFAEDATVSELVDLAAEAGVPFAFDIGSGLIDVRAPWLEGPPPAWLADEPGVVQSLEKGADLVMFSGDKLFGGPQAGILAGSGELIGRLKAHPISRALRLDGPTLNALTVTAEIHADGRAGELPFWRMATLGVEELDRRSRAVLEGSGAPGSVVDSTSTVGAGSVPGSEVPSRAIAVQDLEADRLYLELLAGSIPVVARREAGSLTIDLRAVDPDHDHDLARLLGEAVDRCR